MMGYSNEKASLNQYSSLLKYCRENVVSQIKTIHSKTHHVEEELLNKELPFLYESTNKEDKVPLVSFDGGLATIFPGELSETKLIKVAGACPPNWSEVFQGIQNGMFHVLSGVLKWPEGADLTEEDVINYTIETSLKLDTLTEMMDHLDIKQEDYIQSMISHLKYKQGQQVEDAYREILEWALIVNCYFRQKNNKKINHQEEIPYLIIKDGSLYPYAKSIGGVMSEAIEKFLNLGDVPIVGMVKASRFVAQDSLYRKAIDKYLSKFKKNCFFQIPKELEAKMDGRDNLYHRYFFSLFKGRSVYEIQIPKSNVKSENYVKNIMDILNSQVTFSYGGSVSTNSYAHQEASLAESEAKFLTRELKSELLKEIKEEKKNAKD